MILAQRVATLRDVAPVIREPLRLGARRLRGNPGVGRYHLRHSGLAIHIRHHVIEDVGTLVQTFSKAHYVPPPEAKRALDRLGRPLHAMDLGANIGMFGAWFLSQWPDARVTAYEADPENAEVHALTTAANRDSARWELVAAAAGTSDGEVRFASGRATNSRLARDDDADAVTVPQHDVIARAGDVDLLKIDIEGAEWALVDDPRFAELDAAVVALEYHRERCPGGDPLLTATRALDRAGYRVTPGNLDAEPGEGMVWGWRNA
jgi:FkbM family methyltransferase